MTTDIKALVTREDVAVRFQKLLGERSERFISSIIQLANSMPDVDANSILNACVTAATLDLSVNKDLGEAWVVPYNSKVGGAWIKLAQFQIGWKGLVQLCMRTNQYQRINVTPVYENQFTAFNSLTEDLMGEFHLPPEGEMVGIVAYFRLTNGFEKTVYWTMDHVKAHAGKYSQTYGKTSKDGKLYNSPWNDDDQFTAMAMKTVLKNTLGKWGPKSIKIQEAILADQSVQVKEGEYKYIDNKDENGNTEVNISSQEILDQINSAKDILELEDIYNDNKPQITKDINLVTALGKAKAKFE